MIRISTNSSDITIDPCVELMNFFYSCYFLLFVPSLFFFFFLPFFLSHFEGWGLLGKMQQ